jgi:hypothetical protein
MDILWLLGLSYSHLLYFIVIWYIFLVFGMLYQEKSGNPAQDVFRAMFKHSENYPFWKIALALLWEVKYRVARFSFTQYTKTGGKYTKLPQSYNMAVKYTKRP